MRWYGTLTIFFTLAALAGRMRKPRWPTEDAARATPPRPTLARAAAGPQAADAESPSVAPSEDDAQADETSAAAASVPEPAHRVKTRHNAHATKKPRRLNARRSR